MTLSVQRTQTGVRIESSLLKVLKGLAEYLDMTLGDLLEGVVLHAFEGKAPFGDETLAAIERLKAVYGCELCASDSHQLTEADV
ncbi:MAG: hypothetical protein HKN77_02475 [Woeseiaceae bacterium]|nr:hypothetical protein [Woeseiaceae bacterium]